MLQRECNLNLIIIEEYPVGVPLQVLEIMFDTARGMQLQKI